MNVLPNNALTVFNVVWDISEDPKNDKKQSNQGNKYEEDRKIIEKNLKKVK